jgi:hypothetical protein
MDELTSLTKLICLSLLLVITVDFILISLMR